MRRTLAGPGSSTGAYQPKLDPGKAAPAGTGGEFRRTATAIGPGASGADYVATHGMSTLISFLFYIVYQSTPARYPKLLSFLYPFLPYTCPLDSGKQAGAGTGGEFRRVGSASGPQSSQANYTATTGIFPHFFFIFTIYFPTRYWTLPMQ